MSEVGARSGVVRANMMVLVVDKEELRGERRLCFNIGVPRNDRSSSRKSRPNFEPAACNYVSDDAFHSQRSPLRQGLKLLVDSS